MLEFGTIVETKSQNGKALAKVNILGRVTNWLPILSSANSFKRSFIPARINEQVAVLDDLLILGSIFNKACSEPAGDNSKEITQFEDGTVISYDSKNSVLLISAVKDMNIKTINLTIEAQKVQYVGCEEISHDGINISKTHKHPQTQGNHFGGGTNTKSPNGV